VKHGIKHLKLCSVPHNHNTILLSTQWFQPVSIQDTICCFQHYEESPQLYSRSPTVNTAYLFFQTCAKYFTSLIFQKRSLSWSMDSFLLQYKSKRSYPRFPLYLQLLITEFQRHPIRTLKTASTHLLTDSTSAPILHFRHSTVRVTWHAPPIQLLATCRLINAEACLEVCTQEAT
jgi:hypothetical protein